MNKFFNKKVEYQGMKFDSQAEFRYYLYLKDLENKSEISNLERQIPYKAVINGKKICTYKADFQYLDKDGKTHVIDVKSSYTAKDKYFNLKKKIIEAICDIEIEIKIK